MKIFVNINSSEQDLEIAVDNQYFQILGKQQEEVEVEGFDLNIHGLKKEDGAYVTFNKFEENTEKVIDPVKAEAKKYPSRKLAGEQFSNTMNAKLVLLDATDFVKEDIDNTFDSVQTKLEQGKWKSAQRRIHKINFDANKPYITEELLQEIKQSIDYFVSNNY